MGARKPKKLKPEFIGVKVIDIQGVSKVNNKPS
jgi:hypothetical protein